MIGLASVSDEREIRSSVDRRESLCSLPEGSGRYGSPTMPSLGEEVEKNFEEGTIEAFYLARHGQNTQ